MARLTGALFVLFLGGALVEWLVEWVRRLLGWV